MQFLSVASALSAILIRTVQAETPPQFSPNVTDRLEVAFGATVITPGQLLTKTVTSKQPAIGTNDTALTGTYLYILLDIDVPGQYAGGPAGSRAVNLHALLTGFKPSGQTTAGIYTLTTTATGPAAYQAPAPPAETPPHPHNYVSLLFDTPADFKVPSSQSSAISRRIGFNITAFQTAAGLQNPIRANYFQVSGN